MFNFYVSSKLIFTKYQQDLNIFFGEVRSDLCKNSGVGEEQILVSTLSTSGYGGEVWVSACSLDRVDMGEMPRWQNSRAWSCLLRAWFSYHTNLIRLYMIKFKCHNDIIINYI